MTIEVPVIKNENGKRVRKSMTLKVDTSFYAHYKWEEKFQEQMGMTLTEYTAKVKRLFEKDELNKADFVSLMKMLYCYVESDELPTFKDFLKIFDAEVAKEIIDAIGNVLNEVGESVSKN